MFLLWGKYVRKYYLRYLLLILFAIAALITVDFFQLRIPEIIGGIVDDLRAGSYIDPNSSAFIKTVFSVLTVALIMLVGRVVWRVSLFYASNKIEEQIRNEMYMKASRLDITYFHNTKVGNIMNWCTSDIETLEQFLGWGTLMSVDGVFLTTLALVKMFILDVSLAFITIIPVLLIAVWGAICESRMSKAWDARQASNDDLYDFSQESFTGIRVIKAFVKENQQIHKFAKIARQNSDVNVKFVKISVLFDVMIELIIAMISSIILGFGGWFAYASITGSPVVLFGYLIELTPGKLVTFFGYFSSLIWPMIALGQVVTMFSQARTSYQRIARFLDVDENVVDKENAVELENPQGKIEFKNFSFTYDGENKFDALKDISLTIKAGETIGVIGVVGSGKSTLVNVLLRLYNVKEGTLFIDDKDIMDIKMKSLRDSIAIVPQDNFLFSDTVNNNIAFSDVNVSKEKVVEAASFADVDKDIVDFKDQYDSLLGENGQTVSGGQKQRIALARAYIKDSPILILDDSVSAVDLKTEEKILKNIKENRQGKTTIIIASRVSTVMELDKVIVLKAGELEAFDSPKNLVKTSDTFSRMVLLQKLEQEQEGGNK